MPSKPAACVTLALAVLVACNDLSGASDFELAGATKPDADVSRPDPTREPPSPSATSTPDAGPPPVVPTDVEVVAPSGLDFGAVPCGDTPPPRQLEVRNRSASEVTFEASLAGGTLFALSPATGAVAAGGTASIVVTSGTAPSGKPVGERTDVLTVTTSDPKDIPHELAVRLTTTGALFEASPTGRIDYGTMNATPKTETLLIRNLGNVDGTISFSLFTAVFDAFDISPTGDAVIPGGGVASRILAAHPPKSGPTEKSATLTFSSSSHLCGPLPATIRLVARRSD